ncbi:MAG: aspartate/glutamate racemase family protein [Candidatus Nezhaarchaeales archaeon]
MSLKVKLLIINPVGVDIWNELTLSYAKQVLSFDVEVVVRNIPGAPPYIETEYEKELVAPLVIKEVVKAGKEGFHGVIINCFDDPGLEGSREVFLVLAKRR